MRMNPFHVWLAKAQSKLSDYRSKRKNSKKISTTSSSFLSENKHFILTTTS